jgi:hypothetical protein
VRTGSPRVVVAVVAPAEAMRGAGVIDCTTPLPARYAIVAAWGAVALGAGARLDIVFGSEPQADRPTAAASERGKALRIIETS